MRRLSYSFFFFFFISLLLYDTVNAREDFSDDGNKTDGGSNGPVSYLHWLLGNIACRTTVFLNTSCYTRAIYCYFIHECHA